MELTGGRVQATLVAGKILGTDEASAMLSGGLTTIGHGYQIEKAISETAKTDTEITKDFFRLHVACRTVFDVLGADLSGSGQIEAMLADPWRGSQVPRLFDELRSLSPRIEIALAMAAQDGAKKAPAKSTILVVSGGARSFQRDDWKSSLESPGACIGSPKLRGADRPGHHRPQRRELVSKRLTAAPARRTGKINVFPRAVFRENEPPNNTCSSVRSIARSPSRCRWISA